MSSLRVVSTSGLSGARCLEYTGKVGPEDKLNGVAHESFKDSACVFGGRDDVGGVIDVRG